MEEDFFGTEDSDQMLIEGEYADPITLLSHQEDELSQKSSAGSQKFSQKSSSGSEKLSQKSSTDPEQGNEEDKEVEYYNSDDEATLALLKKEKQLCFEEEVFSDDLTGVQLYNQVGYPIDNEDIMSWMRRDSRLSEEEDRIKLLPKVRRYIQSTNTSRGYDTTGYPGFIEGLSIWVPKQYLILYRDRYPEGYNHLIFLCTFALSYYHQKKAPAAAEYKVVDIITVNSSTAMGNTYKITFTGYWRTKETFRACIWEDTVNMHMEIRDCFIVPASTSSAVNYKGEVDVSELPHSVEEEISGVSVLSDPVEVISSLSRLEDPMLLEMIRTKYQVFPKIYGHFGKVREDVLLGELRKYFISVITSQGFKCNDYPGHIPGLTDLIPRDKIIYDMDSYPECYDHVKLMAELALEHYLDTKGIKGDIVLGNLLSVNLWKESSRSYIYYVTFKARDMDNWCKVLDGVFQAKLWDKQHDIDVIFCKLVV